MSARNRSPADLPPDVAAHVRAQFPPREADAALACLAGAVIETGRPASDRLLRAAAVAARGSLERLQYYISLLAIDWRDVIVAGEYEPRDGKLSRVRDLNRPIPPHD